MKDNQVTDTKDEGLAGFNFDDDSVFDFGSNLTETSTSTKTSSKNVLKEFDDDLEDDGAAPTKLDGKTDKQADKIPAPVQKTKPKVEEKPKPASKKEEDGDEEIEDPFEFEEVKGKEVKKEAKKEEPKKAKTEEVEEEEDEEEEEEEEVDDDTLDEDFYTNLALDLKDRGTLQEVEIPKDKKLTREEFFDLQEDEVNKRFEEAIDGFAESFDEDGKEYIKWKKNGGSTRDFVVKYLAPTFDLKEFDEENETHIKKTIDHYLRTVEELDGEELEERKEFIKNGGKSKIFAKTAFSKITKADNERKKALQEELDSVAKEREEKKKAFDDELNELLKSTETVGSFTISKEDRKRLGDYMTKPTVKAGKNSFVPQVMAELGKILKGATPKDKKHFIILSKIIQSNFKLDDLEAKVETRVTKDIKTRIKKGSPKLTSGGRGVRQLADAFED